MCRCLISWLRIKTKGYGEVAHGTRALPVCWTCDESWCRGAGLDGNRERDGEDQTERCSRKQWLDNIPELSEHTCQKYEKLAVKWAWWNGVATVHQGDRRTDRQAEVVSGIAQRTIHV